MKKKNLKPIDIDAHFKYRCPKRDCGYDCWLSIKQIKTKNFKVVCDCGTVFKPKQISKIKILYQADSSKKIIKENLPNINSIIVPLDLQKQCSKILVGYGFTENECATLVQKAYQKNQTDSVGSLVKYIIQNLGALNEFN
jgi:hypothetical protein